jgi:KUP system potassium uptake protein
METQRPSEANVAPLTGSHAAINGHGHSKSPMHTLALGALGVVFGDIGTSPLYAVRHCLYGPHGVPATEANVLGVLSLIFWSMTIVVSIKYLGYVLRADNHGEGGILALMALASRSTHSDQNRHRVAATLGLIGAALLYGDGMITPAISVLSAVEGLEVASPQFKPYVVPLTVGLLVGLFSLQPRGTARIGAIFGPVTGCWFLLLAFLGVIHLVEQPHVLTAFNPLLAIGFLKDNGAQGAVTLGSVFLVVTGAEALYADMGHFGPRPIRLTWFYLVWPALMLNYLGQGALLLTRPSAAENPFFEMVPHVLLYPTVILATCATIVASQALITGAFSLTRQAIMLGYCPRLHVVHTSAREIGQIYVPFVNWSLMIATVSLVLGFKSSEGLAAAYGIAVSVTMITTTLLAYVVSRKLWGWSAPMAMTVSTLVLIPELAFVVANALKIADGGWFPLVIGAIVMLLLTTWKRGRGLVASRYSQQVMPLATFWTRMQYDHSARVEGTAVYMTSLSAGTPPAMLQMYLHGHVVHEQVILLTVITEESARVTRSQRVEVQEIEPGLIRVIAHYGFVEHPDIPKVLTQANIPGFDMETTTFFLGRETVIATTAPGMALWRENIFAYMTRNAYPATALFRLPPERVVEIGSQIEI